MSSSVFLASPSRVLVADASVLIGLNGSGYARRVIALTSGRVLVSENAIHELRIGAKFGHDDGAQLDALIADGLVHPAPLGPSARTTYEALIDGSYGETLDDGEAATIAVAMELGGVALLDERKARRMCASLFPDVSRGCTAQWILAVAELGQADQANAMICALQKSRMRVPPEFVDQVVALIGAAAAAACPSLPRMARRAS